MGCTDEDLISLTGYGKAETIQQRRLGCLEAGALRREFLIYGTRVRTQQQPNQASTNSRRRGRNLTAHATNPRSLLVIILQEAAGSSGAD